MKATQAQQQALLSLLGRLYSEIHAIEETYGLRARPEDFRPRIDYFHDAIRALTSSEGNGFEHAGRLSVESLAQDVSMLRQIKMKPLVRHPELNIPLSPRTDVTNPPLMPPAPSNRIDVSVAATLGEGYGHYALLFVALLAYPAERNYMNRLNECNNQEDMLLDTISDALPRNMDAQVDAEAFLATITDPDLRNTLLAAIRAGKKQQRTTIGDILHALQKEKDAIRKTATRLESSHLHFASSQLVLYQEAQGIVKKMAAQGLNIVGEFVENAVREAQRGGRSF